MAMLFPEIADLPEGFVYREEVLSSNEEARLAEGLRTLAFGVVVGVSLLGACRLRFQQGHGAARKTRALTLAPRSAYVLDGAARWQWQHAIPPGREERYSVTFRTLRARDGGA